MRIFLVIFAVEALAASWIEIASIPSNASPIAVEALAASWIEICVALQIYACRHVEALAASWIEILRSRFRLFSTASKPLRLRGLKWT